MRAEARTRALERMARRLLLLQPVKGAWVPVAAALAGATVGCAAIPRVLSLTSAEGATTDVAAAEGSPLEVVTVGTGVRDPLPVRGSDIAYADLESVFGRAVSAAAVPWTTAHRSDATAGHGGRTLLVELASADADLDAGGRVVVAIGARATLRARHGNVYLGQTQLGCHEGGLVEAEGGAPVVHRCVVDMARELVGWLAGGVPLEPPQEPGVEPG